MWLLSSGWSHCLIRIWRVTVFFKTNINICVFLCCTLPNWLHLQCPYKHISINLQKLTLIWSFILLLHHSSYLCLPYFDQFWQIYVLFNHIPNKIEDISINPTSSLIFFASYSSPVTFSDNHLSDFCTRQSGVWT